MEWTNRHGYYRTSIGVLRLLVYYENGGYLVEVSLGQAKRRYMRYIATLEEGKRIAIICAMHWLDELRRSIELDYQLAIENQKPFDETGET